MNDLYPVKWWQMVLGAAFYLAGIAFLVFGLFSFANIGRQ